MVQDATAPVAAPAQPSTQAKLEALTEVPEVIRDGKDVEIVTMAHIAAPVLVSQQQRRKALKLCAAMDISGSMAGAKLALAKESLTFMVKELTDNDEFGLVTFDSTIETVISMAKMSSAAKSHAETVITAVRERGCTNLSGGLFAAIDEVHGKQRPNPPPQLPREAPVDVKMKVDYSATVEDNGGQPQFRHKVCVAFTGPSATRVTSVTVQSQNLAPKSGFELEWEPAASRAESLQVTVAFADHIPMGAFCLWGNELSASQQFTLSDAPATAPPASATAAVSNVSRAVMLFTDGLANEGIQDVGQLTTALRATLSEHSDDFVVYTFGFGSDHNCDMLRKIAEATQGSYSFIQTTDTMKEAFADCLGGLMSLVMTKLRLTFQPSTGVEVVKVWTAFPNERLPNGSTVVSIKDLFSEEQRDILLKVKIASVSDVFDKPSNTLAMGKWSLTYESAITLQPETVTAEAHINVGTAPYTGAPDLRVDEQKNRIAAVEQMAAAKAEADRGDVEAAKRRLEHATAALFASPSACTAQTKCMMQEMCEVQACVQSANEWQATGQYVMEQKSMAHKQQRCNDSGANAMYQNAWKMEAKKKASK